MLFRTGSRLRATRLAVLRQRPLLVPHHSRAHTIMAPGPGGAGRPSPSSSADAAPTIAAPGAGSASTSCSVSTSLTRDANVSSGPVTAGLSARGGTAPLSVAAAGTGTLSTAASASSSSNAHPTLGDVPPGARGAFHDPTAGPNSRPATMDSSANEGATSGNTSGGEGANSSTSNEASSTTVSHGLEKVTPVSEPGVTASSSSSTGSSSPTARETHVHDVTEDVRDPVRGPSSSPVPPKVSLPDLPPPTDAADSASASATESSVLDADGLPETASPRHRHPFNTYQFVTRLQQAGVSLPEARALMEGVRSLIVRRSETARIRMLNIEDMDKAAYRFKAALSELRTEQSVRTRNDGTVLRSAASAMRREVDGLEQQMKVDLQSLRHDIDLDLNNRKADTRSDMKAFDIATEEINNKFTILLGDLRTEIESAKWDATRRAISVIAMLVVAGIALSTVMFSPPASAPSGATTPLSAPDTHDMGVGTDDPRPLADDSSHMNEQHAHMEKHLDTLLQDRKWRGDRGEPRQRGIDSDAPRGFHHGRI